MTNLQRQVEIVYRNLPWSPVHCTTFQYEPHSERRLIRLDLKDQPFILLEITKDATVRSEFYSSA